MEIVISIIGIILSIIMFYLGRYIEKRDKKDDYTNQQIDKIVDRYNDWYSSHYDNGLHALSKLGLCILENDRNIRRAIEKICITCGERPLKAFLRTMKDHDTYLFFEFIAKHDIDVFKNSAEEILEMMSNGDITHIKR